MPATIIRFGDEQRVNTETRDLQFNSSVTALSEPDGGWVITWTSLNQDGSTFGIYQQRYDGNGIAIGRERLVTGETSGAQFEQEEPSVTALVNGGWVVTWTSQGQDGELGGIYQRVYDRDGNPDPKGEMKVNTTTDNQQFESSVTALADGGWLVTWTSDNQDRSYYGVYQQRYDANGDPVDGEQLVNTTYTKDEQYLPSTTGLKFGGWVTAWASIGQDDDEDEFGEGIYLSHRDENGVVTIKQVNTEIAGNQTQPSVTALADGGWIVTWTSFGQDGSRAGIFQQRYDRHGVADTIRGETGVNSETIGDQTQPSVTALADGGWVVTWTSFDQDGSGTDIFQQRYNKSGDPVWGEQQVNIDGSGIQALSSVTALADGGWLVTWTALNQDGSDAEVHQRRYMPVSEFGGGKEYGTGTNGDDVFQVRNGGLTTGDSLDGGDGNDTLQMIEAGTLDITAPDPFTSIEIIEGSGGNDVIVLEQIRAMDFSALQGGDGNDALHLRAGSYDFRNVLVSDFEAITLLSNGTLFFDDKTTALLTRSLTREGTLTLTGGSFSEAEIATLFTRGVIEITDDNGTHEYLKPTAEATTTTVRILMTETTGPFQDPVITGSPGMTFTATVTMSAPDRGRFVSTKGGEYNPETGVYTVTGTAAEVEAALKALTFDPRDRGDIINHPESTSLTLVVSDGVQSTNPLVTVVESIATNVAPGVPILSHAYIQENAKAGDVVGDVTAIDPNPGDPLTIALVDDAGGRFVLGSDGKLRVAEGAALDYETTTSHQITIKVSDAGKLVAQKTFTIQVGDITVESIRGTARADVLVGGSCKDRLYGGLGNDTLTGDKGQDNFVFDTKPNTKTNRDKIVDFSVKDDTIWLDNKVFAKLGKAGTEAKPAQLKKDFFTVGSKAKDKNDYIVYDKTKGMLFYDADGSGKGKAVEIATLSKKLAMTYKDFFVI